MYFVTGQREGVLGEIEKFKYLGSLDGRKIFEKFAYRIAAPYVIE